MIGALLLVALGAADGGVDWEIVPGERVGPITAATTEAELLRLFGPDSLFFDDDLPGGAILIPHQDPASALHLTWCDRQRRAGVCEVGLQSGRFQWRTGSGLKHGLSVEDVVALHGRTVRLEAGGVVRQPAGRLTGLGTTLFLTFKPDSQQPPVEKLVLRRSFVGPAWDSSEVAMAPYTATLRLKELRVLLMRSTTRSSSDHVQ